MQGSDKVLVQNSSVLCHVTDYFSRLRSVSWTESWHLIIKNIAVLLLFSVYCKAQQGSVPAVHTILLTISLETFTNSLSQIFIVIANNKYTAMAIIFLFLLVILMTAKGQN